MTLSEELGWRGYLYHLWRRRFGFWRYSLFVGLIWGVWHWPMNYLFGLNYPQYSVLGIIIFPMFTMLLSVLMTLVRDHGRSVWAAGILHGVWNAVSVATALALVLPQTNGLSAVAAMAVGAALTAVFQRRDPCREATASTVKPRPSS
jgi:membrane protease YdiL (CAAX protease family)